MSRLLLLVSQEESRRVLEQTLTERHEVVAPEEPEELQGLAEDWDLILLDKPILTSRGDALRSRREVEADRFLPVVLFVPRERLTELGEDAWTSVDDVLTTPPLADQEVAARVGSLLRIRELSLAMEASSVEDLRRSEQRFRLVTEVTSDFAYSLRPLPDGWGLDWATPKLEPMLGGRPSPETDFWAAVVEPDHQSAVARHVDRVRRLGEDVAEIPIRHGETGEWRCLRDHARLDRDEGPDGAKHIVGGVQDVTEKHQAEAERRRALRALRVLSASNRTLVAAEDETELYRQVGTLVRDEGGYQPTLICLREAGDEAWRWFGPFPQDEADRLPGWEALHRLAERIQAGEGMGIVSLAEPDVLQELGTDGDVLVIPIDHDPGQPRGALFLGLQESPSTSELHVLEELGQDLSFGTATLQVRAREQEQRAHLQFLAYHDPDSRLPNRVSLVESVTALLAEAETPVVLVLEVVDYRNIRDTLGTDEYRFLMANVAERIRTWAEPAVGPAMLEFGRIGFVWRELSVAEAQGRTRELLDALETPMTFDGVPVLIQGLAGVAVASGDSEDGETLVQAADSAVQSASLGGERVARYSAPDRSTREKALSMLPALKEAIDGDELVLHYQPKIAVSGRALNGMEGLIRWPDGEGGMIPPDAFIPLAERTGLIEPLTSWVLATGVRQLHRWQVAGGTVPLALNVSTRDLRHPTFVDRVADLLATYAVDPSLLELEVTEEALMEEPESVLANLHRLREVGVGLAIDDFGTGYSSLAYLKNLPVTKLKIDRAFIQDLAAGSHVAIVRSAIYIAHEMGMGVIAEGVEDEEALAELEHLGCEEAQGFYIARPMPASDMERWLV